MKLTRRESDVLTLVHLYADVHGRPPMQEHIAAGIGHKSRQRVQQILKQPEAKGLVKLEPYRIRGIEIVRAAA